MRSNARHSPVEGIERVQLQEQRHLQVGHRQEQGVKSLHLAGRTLRHELPGLTAQIRESLARAHGLRLCHALLVRQAQVGAPFFFLSLIDHR